MDIKVFFMVLIIACAAVDTAFVILFLRKGRSGRLMGMTAVSGLLATVTYAVSINVKDIFVVRLFSALYFIGVLMATFMFMLSALRDLKYEGNKKIRILKITLSVFVLIDIAINLINIFKTVSLDFVPVKSETNIAFYTYQMYPLYYYHLILSYLNFAIPLGLITYEGTKVPGIYKPKYAVPVAGCLLAIAVNAIFLIINKNPSFSKLDFSIILYPILLGLLYYGKYLYSKKGMVDLFKEELFNSIDQGFVIFDIENKFVFENEKAKEIFPKIKFNDDLTLDTFLEISSINSQTTLKDEDKTFQLYIKSQSGLTPYITNQKILHSRKNVPIGKLYTFTKLTDEEDMLTGFENLDSFLSYESENEANFIGRASIGVIDINGLGLINSSRGWVEGDRLIKELSNKLREGFPEDSYFIRGEEASLIVLCFAKSSRYVRSVFKKIAKDFETYLQYCTSEVDGRMPLRDLINETYKAMRVNKLLDNSSSHSMTISSLIKALEECDPDTESHVKRTQKMGEKLGESLGLSYLEQSKLSLLCLLHDIGKIGIPLEILNKPGKLTEQEFEVIKTHSIKGYEIAGSSEELSSIADMIRGHHERWDGSGYPDGLKGDMIPVLSRIISIIDAYDAMISNRVYRKGMSKLEALKEIERCSGSQFDPYIAKKFITLIMKKEGIQDLSISEKVTFDAPKKKVAYDNVKRVPFTRYIVDKNNILQEIDENFTSVTGYERSDVIGTNFSQSNLIPLEDKYEYDEHVKEESKKGDLIYFEHRIIKKDGSLSNALCFGRRYFDSISHDTRSEIVLTLADGFIPSSIKSQSDIDEMDAMTGLCNRRRFTERSEQRMKKGKFKFAFMILNITNFTAYNQMYGMEKGDEVLKDLSSKIHSFVFTRGFTCRLDGGTFGLGLFYDKRLEDSEIDSRIKSFTDALELSFSTIKDYPKFSTEYVITDDQNMSIDSMIETLKNKK